MLVNQLCLTPCDPMDCSLPDSSCPWNSPCKNTELVAIPFSRAPSWPRDQTQVSHIAGRFLTIWATRNPKYIVPAAAAKLLQSCLTLWPHRWQPTRLPSPWDSPGKNTGVGCHFLLQCMKGKVKVKSLSHIWLLATPWTTAYQAPPSMGFSRREYWSGMPLPSPKIST